MLINQKLEACYFKDSFKEEGIVCINEFLESNYAFELNRVIHEEVKDTEWCITLNPVNGKKIDIRVIPENKELIDSSYNLAIQEFITHENLSFAFHRILPEFYPPKLNDFFCFLESDEMLLFLEVITDMKLRLSSPPFLSYYSHNSFLTPHRDKNKAHLAFLFYLSKNWHPAFGGNLVFLDESKKDITKVCVPNFNCLVLFEVFKSPKTHYVSPIAQGIPYKRLAATAWYDKVET